MKTSLEDLVSPKETALIVYDMQIGVLSQIQDGKIVASVGRLLGAARKGGIPVFFTRHMSLPKPLMGTFAMRQAMVWQHTDDPAEVKPWFLPTAPGFQIVPELTPTTDEAIVDKITMSAFEGTYLPIALRDLGLKSFIIAGVALEIGIEPTIRHGSDLGLIPILPQDAWGCGHAQAAERSLESIRFTGDTILTDVDTLAGLMAS